MSRDELELQHAKLKSELTSLEYLELDVWRQAELRDELDRLDEVLNRLDEGEVA